MMPFTKRTTLRAPSGVECPTVSQTQTARTQAETQVRSTVSRAGALRDEIGKRVEPVVGQVQAQLGELPERVVQAMEPVAARVRELGGQVLSIATHASGGNAECIDDQGVAHARVPARADVWRGSRERQQSAVGAGRCLGSRIRPRSQETRRDW